MQQEEQDRVHKTNARSMPKKKKKKKKKEEEILIYQWYDGVSTTTYTTSIS